MTIPQSLIDLARPWATYYADSKMASDSVTFVHLAGLVMAGGAAVAADRATLRTPSSDAEGRARTLHAIRDVHRWVLIGLVLTFISGLLFVASDLKTYLGATVFWVKMGLIALLLVNGVLLQRTERIATAGSPSTWGRLRAYAGVSLVLWFAIVFVSILVSTAA